jgi:magnesium-transporting ATPase (P-type)
VSYYFEYPYSKTLGINTLFEKLQTSPTQGIATSTLDKRVKAFGTNAPPEAEIESCIMLFIGALNDLTLIILMVAAVVSIIINTIVEEEHRNIGNF